MIKDLLIKFYLARDDNKRIYYSINYSNIICNI